MIRSLIALAVAVGLHTGLLLSLPAERPTPALITKQEQDVIDMEFARRADPPPSETPASLVATSKGATRPSRKAIPASAPASPAETATTGERESSTDEQEPSRRVVGFYDPWNVDELPTPRSLPALSFEPGTRLDLVVTVAGSGRVEGIVAADSSTVSEEVAREVRRIRFIPARVGADAATTTVTITILFDSADAGARTWKRVPNGWTIRL